MNTMSKEVAFQSPYGGRGRSDKNENHKRRVSDTDPEFQSPYGGRGRSDRYS